MLRSPSFMRTYSSIFLVLLLSWCPFAAEASRKELRTKEVQRQQISQIDLPGRLGVIDPTRVTQVAWRPRVFMYRNFVSEEECDHLISWVQGKKSNSVVDGDLKETDNLPSKSIMPLSIEDQVVARIEERISAWTFIPKENGRPLQVLHFDSEEPKQNHDNFGKEYKVLPNEPLMATVVLYLSNASQGGHILFPESENEILSDCTMSNMALKPTKGNAVVFFSVHLNGSADNSSRHARCPILDGDMWCATKFFHLRAIRGKKEPLHLDDTDCMDEDENCPHWAATGECERNPVFMVGSPDYYGACRKSCNVCSLLD
ncbi:unnamed protein product [Coffea canephora]|uniref:procollagen-proline 4-dioxygenase n=2 Tax=Coffea TaxID=13442 RepID=A0A068U9P5_COFCA|nr:probable prolyl 4-hydroxylase 12 isoform X2 [Coffea arabica]CDP05181.1 unnamed protein product [Coffea canephora]